MAALAAERGELHRIRRLVLSAPIHPWSRIGFLRVRFLRTVAGRFYLTYIEPRLPFVVSTFFSGSSATRRGFLATALPDFRPGE